jgi:hypothetical protein
MFSEVADTEIRNGIVISKEQEKVSCSHSYSCNCNKNGCSTCFEHPHDYDWVVHTNIPHKFVIDRIDSRGVDTPSRWKSIQLNDSVSDSFTYVNYIKSAKYSLYHDSSSVDISKVPDYPSSVYDYQYVDRVIGVDAVVEKDWNKKLQNVLGTLGPKYQVNVIIIVTTLPESFDHALNVKWLGGKKNDAVVVFHLDNEKIINSVFVMSWTDRSIFKVELRDSLLELKTFDFDKSLTIIESQIRKNWQRKPMKDFEYLRSEIELNPWIILMCLIVSVISYIVSYLTIKNRFRTTYYTWC